MDPKQLARNMGIARVTFGLGFMLLPGLTGRVWIGDEADGDRPKVLTQAIGARDLVMGLGILGAMGSNRPVKGWLQMTALTDALDFLAGLVAGDRLPPWNRRILLALAGGSALQGAIAAAGIDDGD